MKKIRKKKSNLLNVINCQMQEMEHFLITGDIPYISEFSKILLTLSKFMFLGFLLQNTSITFFSDKLIIANALMGHSVVISFLSRCNLLCKDTMP
jgi:hypothetical protein